MDRNEAIEIVRKNWPDGRHQLSEALETLIPELKESEDKQKPIIKDELFDHRYAQHLVENQRQKSMIQWKGDNLKEVIDFTGKDRNFDKWFKSFEEYEQYVQKHNGIFKLFNADGSNYEVPLGAWIIKTPDGYNVASKAIFRQKNAWSEEDEKMLNKCIEYASSIVPVKATKESGLSVDFKRIPDEKAQDWLKALKERYTWKPSDEQMRALKGVASYNKNDTLESLYNDLKKLTE